MIVADIVDVLLSYLLHVELPFILWMSIVMSLWQFLTMTATKVRCFPILLLIVNLRWSQHDTRCDFLSLGRVLSIFVWDLGTHPSHWVQGAELRLMVINRDLTYMCSRNDTWSLVRVNTRVIPDTFEFLWSHWSVPWWCMSRRGEYLISHIKVWRRRVESLCMRMFTLGNLTEIVFSIGSIICTDQTINFWLVSILPWNIRSHLRWLSKSSKRIIGRFYILIVRLVRQSRGILVEWILSLVNSGRDRHRRYLARNWFIDKWLLSHWLRLLFSWIVIIVACEYIIVIDYIIKLLFLKSLLINLVSIKVNVIYLLTLVIELLVREDLLLWNFRWTSLVMLLVIGLASRTMVCLRLLVLRLLVHRLV